jgi:hypothetical protein
VSRLGAGRPLLVALFVLTLPLVTPKIRGADEIEYFSYLRSLAFDLDLDFGNEYRRFYEADPAGLAGFKDTFLDLREPGTGRHINFAPLGSALLWSPFYLLAHLGTLAARALGAAVPADGFSAPYVAAVCYGSAVYGFLGLLLVHDMLRRFGGFPEPAASWTVAALWLATPVLYYMTLAPAFSHACSLFAVALLLWLTLRARERGTWTRDAAAIGAASGLAALVREQDVLFLAVPAGLVAAEALRRRTPLPGLAHLAVMAAAAVAAFLPQLLAYRVLNGSWGPSRMVARKMTWWSPHFLEVLFDPAHGLYAWSPLLLVASAGLVAAVARRRGWVPALLGVALLLQVWINGSVESWTQAGAFGSRRFVGATPVFAWGLAGALAWLLARRGPGAAAAVVAVFVWWNASLMVQFGLRLMDRQRLEWPQVAVRQVTDVPPRIGRTAWLFFTDRERLVREAR